MTPYILIIFTSVTADGLAMHEFHGKETCDIARREFVQKTLPWDGQNFVAICVKK